MKSLFLAQSEGTDPFLADSIESGCDALEENHGGALLSVRFYEEDGSPSIKHYVVHWLDNNENEIIYTFEEMHRYYIRDGIEVEFATIKVKSYE